MPISFTWGQDPKTVSACLYTQNPEFLQSETFHKGKNITKSPFLQGCCLVSKCPHPPICRDSAWPRNVPLLEGTILVLLVLNTMFLLESSRTILRNISLGTFCLSRHYLTSHCLQVGFCQPGTLSAGCPLGTLVPCPGSECYHSGLNSLTRCSTWIFTSGLLPLNLRSQPDVPDYSAIFSPA